MLTFDSCNSNECACNFQTGPGLSTTSFCTDENPTNQIKKNIYSGGQRFGKCLKNISYSKTVQSNTTCFKFGKFALSSRAPVYRHRVVSGKEKCLFSKRSIIIFANLFPLSTPTHF